MARGLGETRGEVHSPAEVCPISPPGGAEVNARNRGPAQEADRSRPRRRGMLGPGGATMGRKPNETNGAADPHAEVVRRACRYIEDRLEEPLTLAVLGGHVGLSPAHLQRVFKRITGITPRQYADA